ncbi:hypothetical protein MKZ38_007390 [Zalerion maritima]|uniref:Uncharacterized protein n=1 Tax=Zalerion maritima TaxID=339359 RepID=A0AAD5WMY5_9PEZI|nr:hypothetical protein MKZ38_007390 [Zalerion maritima]
MGDADRDMSHTLGSNSPPQPALTDSHTEVQSDPAYMPLIYLTFDDWRSTVPRSVLGGLSVEQQYESYQRLIMLLTRLSSREMPEGSPITFPKYAIVPQSGRPVDVVKATEDFVDAQDLRHDLRLAESRLERRERELPDSKEVDEECATIMELKKQLEAAHRHFECQGLGRTVLLREFTIMKEWSEVLGDAMRSGKLLQGFASQEEMAGVLKRVDMNIISRESQLVKSGILPLVEAPQTAKRLAANILTSADTSSAQSRNKDPANSRAQTSSPENRLHSPKRSSHASGGFDEDANESAPPSKKRRTDS